MALGIGNSLATIPGFVGPIVAAQIAKWFVCLRSVLNLMNSGYCSDLHDYWEGPNLCPPHNGTHVISTHGFTQCSVEIARKQWRDVFYLAGGIFMFGAIVFVLFGSANIQVGARLHHNTHPSVLE